jgi:diguanylate cyclase (GGDEF)-like protein
LVHDLSNLAQSRHDAMTDELTGIANRRALLAGIDAALLTADSTTLLIIDLDRFKAINDRYGHEAGDLVLRHMVKTFSALMPEDAMLARLGGDEFAVLLTDAEPGVAVELARSLALAAAPLSDVKGRLLQVGASVGVATVDNSRMDGGELLRRADAAMYLAKSSGSGVGVYDGMVDAVAQRRLELIEELHRALTGSAVEREQIVVYFQPQLDTGTGRVTGAEALVRWQHPRRGLLVPDLFIDLAEENELMAPLTGRVLREAARHAARWRGAGHPLRVSVNLSASCLSHASLLPLIDEVLGAGLAAQDLVLEVTETSLMRDPELALVAMQRIADRGVGVSIDDYGTGYSSLSYLNDLPATELKIDRTFTARVTSDPRTVAIVAGTVELAHRLGMRLIAEGVEDEQTLTEMIRLGCDETQGYLHSRPLPAEVFLAWLVADPAGSVTTPAVRPEPGGGLARARLMAP